MQKSRKTKKQDNVADTIKLVNQAIENDPTVKMIDFMREEMDKCREHETKLLQMLCQTFSSSAQQPSPPQEYGYQLEHMFCHLHLNMIALLHTCLEILQVHLLIKGFKVICMYYNQHLQQTYQPCNSFSTPLSLSGQSSNSNDSSGSSSYQT